MIECCADHIPITLKTFGDYFYNIFFPTTQNLDIKNDTIYGLSCRTLFYTLMKAICNEDTKILTTPIHHTSFRDIIEIFINKDNITILDIDDTYSKVLMNDIDTKNEYTLCIITHLFGKDLDCENLLKVKQNNPKCIFIEDRVQGGYFNKKFSHPIFDVVLYSTGMDKKPCALGGGILYHRYDLIKPYIKTIKSILDKYKDETKLERFMFLIKKIPTYFIYNYKCIVYILISICVYLNIPINDVVQYYRNKNSGFLHTNFNRKLNKSTLISIINSQKYIDDIENVYTSKWLIYDSKLKKESIKDVLYPYYKDDSIMLTTYNTVYIKDDVNLFINFMNINKIIAIKNPTYKCFNFKYKNKQKYIEFINSLVYIPSVVNMNEDDMNKLVDSLKSFVCLNKNFAKTLNNFYNL